MDAISPAAARPHATHAHIAPLSPRRVLLGALTLTFALLTLTAWAGAERASACVSSAFSPLALSTFEGADGDQCDSDGVGAKRDWQTVAGNANLHSTIDAPSADDTTYGSNNAGIVGGSTSEIVPDSWNFTYGNIGGGKFDALSAASFTDPESNNLFLDLGFVRATTTGDTFLAFELNQRQPGYRLDPNEADATQPFSVPTRTRGDLLVTYHVGTGGAEQLGLCVWDGNEHSGRWEEFTPDLSGDPITNQACPALSSALYQAAMNDGLSGRQGAISGAENYLDPGTPISAGQFGEAVVNLTDALRDPDNPDGPQPCVDFGYVWLHSRSSDSLTSNQQDFILPAHSISIGSCTVEGMKFNDLDGDGSRSAGEPYLGGWTMFVDYDNDGVLDNNLDATLVNDMDGIVEPGEEEPYNVTADGTGTEPLGTYRITKVQPSNHSDAAGTWPVREILQSTWDCTAAVGAGAVLLPNVCPEDTSTNPDTALGFRLAWTDNQTYSGRDFGNRRRPAQLKVVKHVVNDNGATATASAWSLHVKSGADDVAGSPRAGDENGDTYTLTDGQGYSVSETGGPTGYAATFSGDCGVNGAVTVAAGSLKTCTITNNDVAPTVKVRKVVVNDNGGTAVPADWQLHLKGGANDVAGSPKSGKTLGDTYTVSQGSFAVSETGGPSGYAATFSGDCDANGAISVTVGQDKTCTITNDDIAPTVQVRKVVVNDNGGTSVAADWQLHLKAGGNDVAGSPRSGKTLGDTYGVSQGSFAVSESDGPSGYAATFSGDCDANGAISVTVGQDKTCTITNDDIGATVKVIKVVTNNDGATKTPSQFQLTVHEDDVALPSFAGEGAPGTSVGVDPGPYTVTEGDHDGYDPSFSADCSGTIALGQTKVCTVHNDDIAPTVKVRKVVVNDNGGTALPADWELHLKSGGDDVAGSPRSGATSGDTYTVSQGSYAVSESDGPSGYAATFSGDCDADGVVAVTVGQDKTCTITNDDVAPTVKVRKVVVNDNGGTAAPADWQLHLTAEGQDVAGSPKSGKTAGDTYTVPQGSYSASETEGPSGYAATFSGGCGANGAISVTVGQDKTCTITNDDIAPTLEVIKHVVNKNGSDATASDFSMHVTGTAGSPAAFDGSETGATKTLDAGAYAVSETGTATGDYSQSDSAGCSGTLAVGDAKTCTITNTRKTGTITVVKDLIPSTDDGRFDLKVDSTVLKQDAADGGTGSLEVNTGPHTISEAAGSVGSLGNYARGISCNNDESGPVGGPLQLNVSSGAQITCTITNRRVLAQPVVVKAGDTFTYHGDTASYTFTVSNTGNSPLHDVHVTDDKCPNVSGAPTSKANDNGDALLDPLGANGTSAEAWVFTCSYEIGDHQAGEANPVVNTATVTATDELDRPVTDTDQHSTTLLHPAIALTKTGPATATAGSRVVYAITAKNTGDVAFAAALVVVTDARCEAPPLLMGTGGDASTGTLDPGDTWQYACAVQSAVGESVIHNVALVDATDIHGRHATAQATADTRLSAPPTPTRAAAANVGSSAPVVAAAGAKLRGPTGCMPRTARIAVTGSRIAQVTFTVDGRSKRIVKKANGAGRYVYTVAKTKLRTGTHRIRARVVFQAGSSVTARTLVMSLNKCRSAVVKPQFTG